MIIQVITSGSISCHIALLASGLIQTKRAWGGVGNSCRTTIAFGVALGEELDEVVLAVA